MLSLRPALVVAVASVVAALAPGCGPPFVVTDSFTPPTEGAFASKPDSLHDYAIGTEVHLDVRTARPFVDLASVEVVSENPELVEVVEQKLVEDDLQVTLHCVAAGTATISFLDDRKRPLEDRVLQVIQPDEIDLAVNMDTNLGYTIPVIEPRICSSPRAARSRSA